jgi:hypothetical protein
MHRQSLVLVAAAALIAGCIYEPYPRYPIVVAAPASFDRS